MNAELPPLPNQFIRDPRHQAHEERERILQARIAELEADAARYRWLRSQHNGPWLTEDGEFKSLDAAIDAAREEK